MAQGADGNWYGYFGDSTTVAAADTAANNLDFGVLMLTQSILGLGQAANIYVNASAGTCEKRSQSLSNFNGTVPNEVGSIFGVAITNVMVVISLQMQVVLLKERRLLR